MDTTNTMTDPWAPYRNRPSLSDEEIDRIARRIAELLQPVRPYVPPPAPLPAPIPAWPAPWQSPVYSQPNTVTADSEGTITWNTT